MHVSSPLPGSTLFLASLFSAIQWFVSPDTNTIGLRVVAQSSTLWQLSDDMRLVHQTHSRLKSISIENYNPFLCYIFYIVAQEQLPLFMQV